MEALEPDGSVWPTAVQPDRHHWDYGGRCPGQVSVSIRPASTASLECRATQPSRPPPVPAGGSGLGPFLTLELDQYASPRKGNPALMTDDDVIEHLDADKFSSAGDALGDELVVA